MRIMTQLRREGMRSRAALKDLATGLGFGFMAGLREKITTVAGETRNQKLEIRKARMLPVALFR